MLTAPVTTPVAYTPGADCCRHSPVAPAQSHAGRARVSARPRHPCRRRRRTPRLAVLERLVAAVPDPRDATTGRCRRCHRPVLFYEVQPIVNDSADDTLAVAPIDYGGVSVAVAPVHTAAGVGFRAYYPRCRTQRGAWFHQSRPPPSVAAYKGAALFTGRPMRRKPLHRLVATALVCNWMEAPV
jgi:hypothetical protein